MKFVSFMSQMANALFTVKLEVKMGAFVIRIRSKIV